MNVVQMNFIIYIYEVFYLAKMIENPKQLILNKSKEILYTEGYKKLSMRNIAKACNIAIGTIYNYYSTKKDLVIEMMTEYWEEYFCVVEKLINSNDNFYIKLNNIFNELSIFIKTFKEVWLKAEFYDTPDYITSGVEKESIYIEKLIRKIEDILIKEASNKNSAIHIKLDSYETAKFILMNFITMIRMPLFQYSSFECFLKELLK
jgi:AcrR family transcriptional regulator